MDYRRKQIILSETSHQNEPHNLHSMGLSRVVVFVFLSGTAFTAAVCSLFDLEVFSDGLLYSSFRGS